MGVIIGRIFTLAGLLFAVFLVVLVGVKGYEQIFPSQDRVNDAVTGLRDFDKGVAAYERGEYAAAVEVWTPIAEQGDAEAQFELGLMYRYGLGVERDYGAAVGWFKRAAEQGNEGGLSNLGLMYQRGLGVPQDFSEAVKWFKLAAEQGEAEAQSNLSTSYIKGQGIAQNYIEAYKWASIAAAQGAERAIKDIDALTEKLNSAQIAEAKRRIREWAPSADSKLPVKLREPVEQVSVIKVQKLLNTLGYQTGNVDGIAGRRTRSSVREFQLREGLQVNDKLTGKLVARLETRVRAEATEAAENKLPAVSPTPPRFENRAPVNRFETVENQIAAVPPTPPRFENSERMSKAREYFRVGYNHAVGNHVAQSDDEARIWYRKAAELGMPEAQYNLGILSARNPKLKNGQNYSEAVKWWQRAAENGNSEAQNALGVSYFKGLGAEQSYAVAVQWFTLAADQGYTEAQLNLANMYENGQGTARSIVDAYKWFAIAAARGLEKAVTDRDRMARRLTREKLRQGQRLVRDWLETHS